MDVVEFSAYALRKQVDERQLYNQVAQTVWGSQLVSSSSSPVPVAVGVSRGQDAGVRASSRQRAWALSDPRLSSPARMQKKCYYGHRNFGSICSSLSPSPTYLSYTRNINPFENKVWEIYFYKEVCSFVHWSSSLLLTMFLRIFIYMYMYCVVVCGYTTCIWYHSMIFSLLKSLKPM